MEPASPDGMPDDVLIVEDDPIIALDFEDTILGFGVKTVRTAASVAKALDMIAERAPDFALLDVGLIREKSFAIAERLEALKIPFVFVTGYGADVRLPAAFARQAEAAKALFDRRAEGLAEQAGQAGTSKADGDRCCVGCSLAIRSLGSSVVDHSADVGAIPQGHGHLPWSRRRS